MDYKVYIYHMIPVSPAAWNPVLHIISFRFPWCILACILKLPSIVHTNYVILLLNVDYLILVASQTVCVCVCVWRGGGGCCGGTVLGRSQYIMLNLQIPTVICVLWFFFVNLATKKNNCSIAIIPRILIVLHMFMLWFYLFT